jgi:acyl-CoA hydrolase
MKTFVTNRLVKSEDLNHHGTLYAGRTAEWLVESAFVAAGSILPSKSIVCKKIHGLTFLKPVRPGQIVCFNSRIAFTGRSSLRVYVKVNLIHKTEELYVEGFVTFIHVNENTEPIPHNIKVVPETEEEREIYEKAKSAK